MRSTAGPSRRGCAARLLGFAVTIGTSVISGFCGCAAPAPKSAGPGELLAMPIAAEIEDLFDVQSLVAARGILDGFAADPPGSPGSWTPGDAVLLGLVIERGPERTVRFLKVEAPADVQLAPGSYTLTSRPRGAPPVSVTSQMFVTSMTLYDEAGKVISTSPGQFPMDCIGRGAYLQQIEIIEHLEAGGKLPIPPEQLVAMTKEARVEQLRRSTWLVAIAPSMGSNPAMQKLLAGVAKSPPLLSMIFGVEVAVSAVGMPRRAAAVEIGGRGYPAASMSLALAINGRPSLEGTLTAVPAVAPLHLCGGLTALDARNPAHPERRVTVRLLASRRSDTSPSAPRRAGGATGPAGS